MRYRLVRVSGGGSHDRKADPGVRGWIGWRVEVEFMECSPSPNGRTIYVPLTAKVLNVQNEGIIFAEDSDSGSSNERTGPPRFYPWHSMSNESLVEEQGEGWVFRGNHTDLPLLVEALELFEQPRRSGADTGAVDTRNPSPARQGFGGAFACRRLRVRRIPTRMPRSSLDPPPAPSRPSRWGTCARERPRPRPDFVGGGSYRRGRCPPA